MNFRFFTLEDSRETNEERDDDFIKRDHNNHSRVISGFSSENETIKRFTAEGKKIKLTQGSLRCNDLHFIHGLNSEA